MLQRVAWEANDPQEHIFKNGSLILYILKVEPWQLAEKLKVASERKGSWDWHNGFWTEQSRMMELLLTWKEKVAGGEITCPFYQDSIFKLWFLL